MLTESEQERRAGEAIQACAEAVGLEELARDVLPRVQRALDASGFDLYQCVERDRIASLGGTLPGVHRYADEFYPSDPIHGLLRRTEPRLFHGTRHAEWGELVRLPVYTFLRKQGIATYLHLRLSDTGHHAPGMLGVLIARSTRLPDFGERDELLAARMLPALVAAARRGTRLAAERRARGVVEAVAELDSRPRLALDLRGALLWASPRAAQLMGLRGAQVPDALIAATRREVLPGLVSVPSPGAAPIRAELRLARTAAGTTFVLAELDAAGAPSALGGVAARAGLTAAETEVLALLAHGLSDREIARRRHVSAATVHTHMARIRGKLGVRSRLEAVLLARGETPRTQ